MMRGEGLGLPAAPGAVAAGAVVALAASVALVLAAPAGAQPVPPPAAPGSTPPPSQSPSEPDQQPDQQEAEPTEGERQPVGPEPIGPVRTFEPLPIPEGMAPPGVRTTPFEPGSGAPPSRPGPAPVDTRPGARPTPAVPGAAEAGFVVVDPQRVFGADALPAVGASVVQASGFTLAASINSFYDDNFLRIEGDLPPGSEGSKSDIGITPLLAVGLGRNINQQSFFFTSTVGRRMFLRNPNRGADQVAVNGGWDWRAGSSCSGRLSGSWSTNEIRATDQLVRTNPINRSTLFLLSGTCALPSGLIPGLTLNAGKNDFEAGRLPFGDLFDSRSWGLTGSLGYAFSARGQVGVQASYQNASFPNQLLDPGLFPPGEAPPPGSTDGVESLGVSGFISYRLSRRLSADGSFGYTRTRSKSPLVDDFSGWTGSLALRYAGPRWGAGLTASRGVSLGQNALTNFLIESVINGTVSYRLRPRVTLSSGFDLAKLDRRGTIGGPVGLSELDDRTLRAFFGTDVQLTRRLALSFDYFHEIRDIEFFDFKTNANQVAGTLRFAFR